MSEVYRVKDIPWVACEDGAYSLFTAETPVGYYSIQHPLSDPWNGELQDESRLVWEFQAGEQIDCTPAASLDAAKSAAHAHYLERLMPALEVVK